MGVEPVLESLGSGLPVLLLHFVVTGAMLVAGAVFYMWVTPYDDLELIRAGNIAASVSLSAAILGIAVPLAVCLATSVSVLDIVLWGLVTVAVQIATYKIADWVLTGLPARIEQGDIGAAIVLAGVKLSAAAINAGAISG